MFKKVKISKHPEIEKNKYKFAWQINIDNLKITINKITYLKTMIMAFLKDNNYGELINFLPRTKKNGIIEASVKFTSRTSGLVLFIIKRKKHVKKK